MATPRTAPLTLVRHLSSTTLPLAGRTPRACVISKWLSSRGLATTSTPTPASSPEAVPLRKHLKEEAKRKKAESRANGGKNSHKKDAAEDKWELTVGIEIHAELNTAHKLFSPAPTDGPDTPNTKVAPFDAALPGSQPRFQPATLLPALRAALALGCDIQHSSTWDRKHYFHWDQPSGYQITQYNHPFALHGSLPLTPGDGIPASDLNGAQTLSIGIKQVQMEQDTAKTTHHAPSTYHIDLNRTGHPLIEIITTPEIHSPQTAAAVVRKIQGILKSVDACTAGMDQGGLRADVNVSIRERGTHGTAASYSGVSGLGQRTEIKNLSSIKAVEDAITAEKARQIRVLSTGGKIEGETRGWTLGATETTFLRGKEGEVDYRYMPDPDLPPLLIAPSLINHLRATLPALPDATTQRVQETYGLSPKDAKTLTSLDDGDRLDFLESTVALLPHSLRKDDKTGRVAGNWVLHELGGLLSTSSTPWDELTVTSAELASILTHLLSKQITARVAKQLLATLHSLPSAPSSTSTSSATATSGIEGGGRPSVEQLIDEGNLRLRPLTPEGYKELAQTIMDSNPEMVSAVRDKGQTGKVMWFVGQMVRTGEEGTVEAGVARGVVEELLLGTGEGDGK